MMNNLLFEKPNSYKSLPPSGSPVEFLPTVGTTVDPEGKIVVEIQCVSEASPEAVVSWSNGSEAVTNGTTHQISSDTTQLKISHYNVSNFLLQNYTCSCDNPLGFQRREVQLRGIVLLLLAGGTKYLLKHCCSRLF